MFPSLEHFISSFPFFCPAHTLTCLLVSACLETWTEGGGGLGGGGGGKTCDALTGKQAA